ncbi:hypothetical protein ATCC90586_000460 [Pythium insidiosum]|nr:hypothetical protein ATCC90586_000460 [Pythium insidiosum]
MFLRKPTSTATPSPVAAPTKSPVKAMKPSASASAAGGGSASDRGLPALGRVNPSVLQPGTKVWVTDPKVLWRIGEVQALSNAEGTAQVYVPDAPDDKVQALPVSRLYTFDASHIVDHDDVAQINNLHEAPLLSVLRQRFESDTIYTFTADVLLSVNPYKTIPLLYDVPGFMAQLRERAGEPTRQPPHLFTIAENAYNGMRGGGAGGGSPQSIIVSGESGAGKTEASKYIMKYLAAASKHAATGVSHVHDKIEESVVLSNLILESFGNAKTSRNDNSSRFGKYIQIQYSSEGRMVGVGIRHFLLEKTRLVLPQYHERNYHVFYQLLAGLPALSDAQRQRLALSTDAWAYAYLTRGDCVEIDGVDDATEFEQLRRCMNQLGLDAAGFQLPLFELLAAILHLGNVQFETARSPTSAGNQGADDTTAPVFPRDGGVDLAHVATLLGVDAKEFATKMVTQTTITGRGSILEMQLSPSQAKNALDAFCKYLYGELFHHLIARINSFARAQTATATATGRSSSAGASASGTTSFIGILDIFGFEVMARNSLEQLCINFTNETLQQQFNRHVFVLEQERYAREGIAFASVEFQDNQPCLDLIQRPPTGLLPLLEEQMLLKRKTTDKQLLTIYHSHHLDKHAHYSKPRFESDEFVVRHYAGDVTYDVNEFIAKNTDNLHDDLLDLLKRSTHPLLRAMFATPESSSAPPQGHAKPRGAPSPAAPGKPGARAGGAALTGATTVTSRFRLQLAELMDVLWSTAPHYIKCIKPNNLKFPGGFSSDLVRHQLVYSGVLEVVRIRQDGYPIRRRFELFYDAFWQLLAEPRFLPRHARAGNDLFQFHRDAAEHIAATCLEATAPDPTGAAKRPFAMGKQEVFLRYGQLERLVALVVARRHAMATRLQARLLGWHARRQFQRRRAAVVRLQSCYRRSVARRRFLTLRSAASVVQATYRGARQRRRFLRMRRAASKIQSRALRFLTRRRFVAWRRETLAAVGIQRHVRGYLCRTAAERARKLRDRSVLALQSWLRMTRHRHAFTAMRRASVVVQATYRAVRQRREFLRRRQASIVLEAFVRQALHRRKFRLLKQRVTALQAVVRQRRHRREFLQLRRAILVLQSKRRQRRAIALRELRQRAVAVLQHAVKGWSARCRFLALHRRTIAVQRLVKSRLRCKAFRRLRRAAVRVQRAWRRHDRTRRWRTELALLFRRPGDPAASAQTAWTTHGRMEDSDRRIDRLRAEPALYFSLRPAAFGFNSLFHHAAACGDFHVAKYMLSQRVVAPRELLEARNGRGRTAFHEACLHAQYEMAKFLLATARELAPRDERPRAPAKGPEEPQQQDDAREGVVFQGFLKKRRETSRWMRRFVVLSVDAQGEPALAYYANDKPATLAGPSAKTIALRQALVKKSVDVPFAFEVHSPLLLEGRNKEGRLYFAADSELESQAWLARLRHTVPGDIESRIFAMHRANKYGKLEFVDWAQRRALCNVPTTRDADAPLHLAARAVVGSAALWQRAAKSSFDVAVSVSASAISVTLPEEDHASNNNSNSSNQQQQSRVTVHAPDDALAAPTKTRVEMEADVVKTVLWLVENGAEINGLNAAQQTPLQLALQARNYLVARHLLDRGALATGLNDAEIEDVQRIKAALAKTAISSVSSSSSSSRTSSAPSLSLSLSSLARTSSFRKKASAAVDDRDAPLLFLQRQPGKTRNSSYVSVFLELLGISTPHFLSRPRVVISVLDAQRHLVEMKQQVSTQPLVLPSALLWGITWHMQTPLENLPHGACVVFELMISPTAGASASSGSASAAADDLVPVCWTYIQVDQRTANTMPLNAEMYKHPIDLSLKRLQRVDAFISGDILISHGPQ